MRVPAMLFVMNTQDDHHQRGWSDSHLGVVHFAYSP